MHQLPAVAVPNPIFRACSSNEALKNAGEYAAWTNLIKRLVDNFIAQNRNSWIAFSIRLIAMEIVPRNTILQNYAHLGMVIAFMKGVSGKLQTALRRGDL